MGIVENKVETTNESLGLRVQGVGFRVLEFQDFGDFEAWGFGVQRFQGLGVLGLKV